MCIHIAQLVFLNNRGMYKIEKKIQKFKLLNVIIVNEHISPSIWQG